MENWLLTLIIILISWVAFTFANIMVFGMEFSKETVFDALALSYIVLGVPSVMVYNWLENTRPNGIIITIALLLDWLLVSYLITGKLIIGKWIGHGNDPGYYTPEMLAPMFLIWILYVVATFAFTFSRVDNDNYLDFYFVFIFMLALCRAILHFVVFIFFVSED